MVYPSRQREVHFYVDWYRKRGYKILRPLSAGGIVPNHVTTASHIHDIWIDGGGTGAAAGSAEGIVSASFSGTGKTRTHAGEDRWNCWSE
jgi:hypothetical protein